ncbi:hypothetical protein E2C01_053496 [Portunus trituberculatus]|uniref:Uncharacterized protein n=1 Tax=Portunus trituberculatus TaxID=210409 RepID=A0A5B7GQG9_PORTR|nr:hypothetical protein [Portunus trituberculatus]
MFYERLSPPPLWEDSDQSAYRNKSSPRALELQEGYLFLLVSQSLRQSPEIDCCCHTTPPLTRSHVVNV